MAIPAWRRRDDSLRIGAMATARRAFQGRACAMAMTKVGFVGAGTIGANSIFATLALTDRIDEIAVVDIAEAAAVGRAMDLNTASVAFGRRTRVHGGTDYALLKGADLV